ncbi:EVE domain protein [candidate division SR1 bacterium Aalborg_AAW-1]|nr:EVE domain protein [candidate division SR1 bacterium Aalborg_AAW-1]
MNYRLIKSEPYKYSREQFVKDGTTMRDGVRNYQARNNLNAMRVGDLCFWYHSNEGKEIVGIAQVSKESYPDPTADEDPKSRVVVEVVPYKKLNNSISLEEIKKDPYLSSISLLKQQRLSVAPITEQEYEYIIKLSNS